MTSDTLPARHKQYGLSLLLLLTERGPRYVVEAPEETQTLRTLGYIYYDETFASLVTREAMRHHGRLKPIRDFMVHRFWENGCENWRVLPMHPEKWCHFLEDVAGSKRD